MLGIPAIRRSDGSTPKPLVESCRQGLQANVEEALLLAKRWEFRVETITFTRMFLWHGEQDRLTPVSTARLLAQALPHCAATYYPDTGHLSTVVTHAHDILRALSPTGHRP